MEGCRTKHHGNIGQKAQGSRLRMSILVLSVVLGLAVFLIKGDYPVWTRGLLFLPLFMVASASFQGLHQICMFAALRGVREMDDGEYPIGDPAERARMKRDAWKILLESTTVATAATALVLFIP